MKKLILLLSLLALNNKGNQKFCDIKGNVKNPGVYQIKENYTINDVIDDAGGLKEGSYTNNINLSKKVKDEMVIYIFTKKEIEEMKYKDNCTCKPIYKYQECITTTKKQETITTTTIPKTTTSQNNQNTTKEVSTSSITTTTNQPTTTISKDTKININTCSLQELISLNGLGEKKAQAIIDYRSINGPYKMIEDILKVNSIGESTLEKIKDYIQV